MSRNLSLPVVNGKAAAFSEIPCLTVEEFRKFIIDSVCADERISSLFGMPIATAQTDSSDSCRLVAVLANNPEKSLKVLSTIIGKSYPAITPKCPQAHMFEREIAEQWGIIPEGHPWLRPARFHSSFRAQERCSDQLPSVANFFRVESEETHEVAVGPVHAGVIEPGHFRFQCHGENVFHLEISLGYQHRGIERALLGGPNKRTLFFMETLAGDTTVGHSMAYCQAMEALSGCQVPPRAQALRAVGLELERMANHTGDLGALGGDVGFLPTASYCGRIRGDFLNMTALLCGSRLGRGFIRIGGTGFDIEDQKRLKKLTDALARAETDTQVAIPLLWDTPAVMTRFEKTGVISKETCQALGLVGLAARACGVQQDVRLDFPVGQYCISPILPVPEPERRTGDVAARAIVRWAEIGNSLRFLKDILPKLPSGPIISLGGKTRLAPDSLVVSLVEGWRGEICHTVITDTRGRFARYKIVDPSFHNWIGLGVALRGNAISDFPLCNKSFNLSYCGFDL